MSANHKTSVYQLPFYKEALKESSKVIDISSTLFGVEKEVVFPLLGKKKILEVRANPSKEDAVLLKKQAKDYFYATLHATVVNYDDTLLSSLGYKKVENHTILLALDKEKEELWKGMEKKSIRWGVKVAERAALSCTVLENNKEFALFHAMYTKTAKKGGFDLESKEVLAKLKNTEFSKIFLVKSKNKIVAGGLLLIDKANNYSILDLTTITDEGNRLQAMPFLYWNLILFSKEQGLASFDLGGYDAHAKKGDKLYNINKFKERFGGEVVVQPIYSTNARYPFLRSLLRKFRFLKSFYRKKEIA